MKFNKLNTILCLSILASPFALAETTVNDKGVARQQLLKLSPGDAYLKIRDIVIKANCSTDIAPYVSSDLARILYAISRNERKNPNALYQVKNMITAFPDKVRIVDKQTTGQISVLKVIPGLETGWTEERRSDYESALVTMNFDGGVWKFKNVELKKISPWCLKATQLIPPDLPVHARILGKKYHALEATLSGSSLNFQLETASSHERISLNISAEKLSKLKRRLKDTRFKRKILTFKRPLKIEKNDYKRIHPQVVIIGRDDKELLGVKTGLGITLQFQNYQKIKSRSKSIETIDGAIFLRLPDSHKSYLEGNFKITF